MSAERRQRRGPPVLPGDDELRVYWRLWQDEQWAAGKAPRLTFLEWRRQWIADQPKNLAAWRAQHRPVAPPPEHP